MYLCDLKPKIILSLKSTKRTRGLEFRKQLIAIQKRFPRAQVHGVVLEKMSLLGQIRLVSDASVYISMCGGGAVTGSFLPRGASVILYYREKGGFKDNKITGKPAMLDWDLWSAASYLNVHWMPRSSHDRETEQLLLLIEHQLSLVSDMAGR